MTISTKARFLLIAVLLIFMFPSSILASAYESGGFGARAISMGGAYIGLADDWTAIYWNPAGLVQLTGCGVGFNSDYLGIETKDADSIANSPMGQTNSSQGDMFFQLPGIQEPTEFSKQKTESVSLLPALGAYCKLGLWTVEIGAYVPLAFSCHWKDSASGVNATYETEASLVAYNISAARPITRQLSLGLGLNILDGSLERDAKKTTPVYAYSLHMKADGIQLQGILGLLYRPLEYLAIGASYKTGSQAKLDGSGSVSYPFPGPTGLSTQQETSDYTQKFLVPAQVGLGLAYTGIEKLILTADWVRTDWSDFHKDIDYEEELILFKDSDEDPKWTASERIRLGAEYWPVENLAVRAGLGIDPRGVSDRAVSQTNLIDVDRKIVSFGVGYRGQNVSVDLGYAYAFGEESIEGVEYAKNTSGVLSSVNYQF